MIVDRCAQRGEETDDGICSIFFNTVLIAKLDERD